MVCSRTRCLVIDLQDIGTRYYTFIWTMYLCLKACSDRGIPVLVCDRPNPINGVTIEERYPILPTGPLSDFIRYRFDMEKRSEN